MLNLSKLVNLREERCFYKIIRQRKLLMERLLQSVCFGRSGNGNRLEVVLLFSRSDHVWQSEQESNVWADFMKQALPSQWRATLAPPPPPSLYVSTSLMEDNCLWTESKVSTIDVFVGLCKLLIIHSSDHPSFSASPNSLKYWTKQILQIIRHFLFCWS